MNVLDLGYEFQIEIKSDPDIDGTNYYINFLYQVPTHRGVTELSESLLIHQTDIDEILIGAEKLIKLLRPHVTTY